MAYNPTTGVPGVAYRRYIPTPYAHEIRFAKANDNTGSVFGPTKLISDYTYTGYDPSLICEASGRWLAVWGQMPGAYNRNFFDESYDDGLTWNSDQLIDDIATTNMYDPSITSNGTDVFVVREDHRSGWQWIWIDQGLH